MSRKPPIELPQTDDPYVLLDVRPGASAEQIRRAYLRRVKLYKPDRYPAEFRRVREAYDRLREHERWFDAWRQAGDVVRKAAEAAAQEEAEAEVGEGEPGQADASERDGDAPEVGEGADEDRDDDDGDDEDDVEALIAALEEELREGRAGDLEDEDDGAGDEERFWSPTELSERRRRSERGAEANERLAALELQVHAALEDGRSADAAVLLQSSEAERLASRPAFATLLLEVCCAAVWDAPDQFRALAQRYGDLVSMHDTEHRDGALLHRRILIDELPAWSQAVAGWPELHRFVVLGASLRAPAEAELGLRLGRRAADDPSAFLRVLVLASVRAPGILALLVGMAERWSRSYGKIDLHREPRARPTVEQAAVALANAVQHDRWVRWEQLRPLLVSAVLVGVMLVARSAVVELVVIGAVLVLWAWRAFAAPPEARIYERVLRPAAAGWLWATHASPGELAAALRDRLPKPGTWAAVLHPGSLSEYPEALADDLALMAFGVTGPMIPLLRRFGAEPAQS